MSPLKIPDNMKGFLWVIFFISIVIAGAIVGSSEAESRNNPILAYQVKGVDVWYFKVGTNKECVLVVNTNGTVKRPSVSCGF